MNTRIRKYQVEKLAKQHFGNSTTINKTWDVSKQRVGWVAYVFGKNDVYMGSTLADAHDFLELAISNYQ